MSDRYKTLPVKDKTENDWQEGSIGNSILRVKPSHLLTVMNDGDSNTSIERLLSVDIQTGGKLWARSGNYCGQEGHGPQVHLRVC